MEPITLLKLGGSVITDKNTPYSPNTKTITNIAKILKQFDGPLIISHGSGSFGHTSATLYGGKKGYTTTEGIAKLSFDASWINHIVMDTFIREHLPALSLRPMSMIKTSGGIVVQHNFEVIEELLNQNLIPVVFGDVIIDTEWKTTIYSGEKVLSEISTFLLSKNYSIEKIIQLGNTEGFYDSNKKTIEKITPTSWKSIKKHVFETTTPDVTGGIIHKVEEALALTEKGISTYLINGEDTKSIKGALTDTSFRGTCITSDSL
jgi:isopentenyl phosphate kinase